MRRGYLNVIDMFKWVSDVLGLDDSDDGSDDEASASGERTGAKDDVRRDNEVISAEIDNLSREHKLLKQIVEQLDRDYEESKSFDPLRRYEKLKGMIKRTVLHLRLNPDEPTSVAKSAGICGLVQGCRPLNHQAESARRREDKYSKMSRQELQQENIQLNEQVRELRRKCAIIRDTIDSMQKSYESSKHFAFMQRYTMLKSIIKRVINDELI